MTIGLFIIGLGLLLGGGEALVRGSSGLATRLGIPPLIVGLTVVAFGTSSPELAVSVVSALKGQGDIALGNVIGSNVLNVLFVLGLAALIAALSVSSRLVAVDVPFLVAVSALVWVLAADGRVSRLEGGAMVLLLTIYMLLLARVAARGKVVTADSILPGVRRRSLSFQLLLVAGGLGMLIVGSRWALLGAVALARALGLSELVIGLTVVAVGTSLPEVTSTVMAAVKGEREIAVGNIVGSNIYNTLGVLGLAAAVAPKGLAVAPAALGFDIPVMVAVAVACLPIFFTGHRIDRWEGGLFLAYYAVYTLFLLLNAQSHAAAQPFGTFMLVFAVPLTTVTLAVLGFRAARSSRSGGDAARVDGSTYDS